jgi:hypothetical protein
MSEKIVESKDLDHVQGVDGSIEASILRALSLAIVVNTPTMRGRVETLDS